MQYEHRPITPEEVLAIFQDQVRHSVAVGNVEPDGELSMEMSVEAWMEACRLEPWPHLAEAENHWWGIDVDVQQWRDVLEPPPVRRLGEVCELIARHARVPDIRPERFASTEHRQRAVFAALKDLWQQVGVPEEKIHPETRLGRLARDHLGPVVMETTRLAPAVLPTPQIVPGQGRGLLIGALSVVLLAGAFTLIWNGRWYGLLLLPVPLLLGRLTQHLGRRPRRVTFEGLETVEDYCRAVAQA